MKEWIALNMTPGVGPRAAARLLERFGSAEGVFAALRSELERLRLRPEALESIVLGDRHAEAERELERVRALGADVLILDDGTYPALLREIADPPITLYVRGEWETCLDAPCVAIVGSRRCSTYGQNVALMLARDLAARGVTIVSGLARGIDAAAHRGAIEAGGRTVGVLGTGLDEVYPRDHKKLAEEILARGGALVSQFPLGTPPIPENFPYRNRIISGLSLGVVLVEAAENSGSLITARLALEQSREVFAVPGNVTSRNSFGTNYLIKGAGAKLVQAWQDVAAELPPEIAARLLPPEPSKKKRAGVAGAEQQQQAVLPADLSDGERAVFGLLTADEPVHIDALVGASRLAVSDLSGVLLGLEMRDLVRQLPGKCFVRKL
jgi:DNA processing protein